MLQGATPQQQAEQLGREFEGVLIRQFLSEALKPMDPEAGFFGAKGSPMHEHLIKDTLASSIAESSPLGLTSVFQAQLMPQNSTIKKGADSHE